MREEVQKGTLLRLMEELGRRAKSPGRVYLVGGASALWEGWRTTTIDVDLKLAPEPSGIFEAIRLLKDQLHVNIELASPDDFLPPLPGWEERSVHIGRYGLVDFFHYDFYGQALAKIDRGHSRDLLDARAMASRRLIRPDELRRLFESVRPALLRYPAVDEDVLARRLEEFLTGTENDAT